VHYHKVDLNTGVECENKTEPECGPYTNCTETTDWTAVAWGDWHYVEGEWCQDVTYKKYDLHNPTQECDNLVKSECKTYEPCTETGDWVVLSESPWVLDPVTNEYSREVTYVKYDLHDGQTICERKVETEHQPGPTPTPPLAGCNGVSLSASAVRQGQSVTVRWSGYGPVTSIVVQLLGDARDGPRPGGVGSGAWYTIGSSGPEGGSTTLSTTWLYPKQRTIRVIAYYPGGSSNCYANFTITPTPTPTLPVPGLPGCPSCVEEIVYQTDRNGQWDIYRAKPDGTLETRLTTSTGDDTAPAWYPSGQYITFQSNRDGAVPGQGGNWEIYTMNRDGSEQKNVSNNLAADIAPNWSCRYIYFQSNRDGNWEIYRMNPDGTDQVRLTDNAAIDAQPYASGSDQVAFQSNRDGNWEIYVMNSDGSNVRRVTNTSWDEQSPAFSPNGEWIAYQTNEKGQWELAVMDLSGQNVHYIVRAAAPDQSPAWSPYCDWIYFQTYRGGNWEIYRTNQDGTTVQKVLNRASSSEVIDNQVW
jgi:TolB protein